MIRPGIYRHYKGNLYVVLMVARHTETNEDMVVYVPLYVHENGGNPIQTRPAIMWNAVIQYNGCPVTRFVFCDTELPAKLTPGGFTLATKSKKQADKKTTPLKSAVKKALNQHKK